jgi:hypothetical protein
MVSIDRQGAHTQPSPEEEKFNTFAVPLPLVIVLLQPVAIEEPAAMSCLIAMTLSGCF